MPYIQVKLLNGFTQPLTYKIPDSWQENLLGCIVKVPLKNRFESAYVIEQINSESFACPYIIKEVHSREPFPHDIHYQKFIAQLSHYYQVESLHFIKRIRNFVSQDAQDEPIKSQDISPSHTPILLTQEQQTIVNTITPHINQNVFYPALIHGVTGSGKTEIYKQLIIQALAAGKTALLLLPEVSLALQFEQLLIAALPDISIFGFHSATHAKNKRLLWHYVLEQKPMLIIGVHIPILLPIANLGLIIVDEEHETGYQEKKHPKVNSKEAALMRAQLYKVPIILGSATPSIASLYASKTKGWEFFQLQKRFAGAFPTIKVVSLTDKDRRPNFWITKELEHHIKERLEKKEQAIIFLNRRGYSFFVQCKDCSFIFECKTCSVSLTLHNNNQLTCHYCGCSQPMDSSCTSCKKTNLIKKGIGTQQVVTILEQLFPTARIGRADMDVTSKKKLWQQTMQDFKSGNIDILVGTQTITKGFHFPNVTLVGVLWADLNLHFPVYNAAETSLQQLIQVAGRAGRVHETSTVIVQTMANHPVFNYLTEIDYLKYYDYELHNRQTVGYPPARRLVEIELKNTKEAVLELEASEFAQLLVATIQKNNYEITLLGPSKPPVSKIKNTHSRKIYLKSKSIQQIIDAYKCFDKKRFKSQIFFTPNPN